MTINTKIDINLEGVDDNRAWKYRLVLILEEKNLVSFVEKHIQE
jgi:hypothetical protein